MYFEWSGGYKFFGYGLTQIYLFRIYVIYRYWACRTTFIICVFKKGGRVPRDPSPFFFPQENSIFAQLPKIVSDPPPHSTRQSKLSLGTPLSWKNDLHGQLTFQHM